jgi:putative ATP-dependent endonuclease of OLD family
VHIKELTIVNYKCIKELVLKFDASLNVLIGKNNSGKTAVIDALRLCLTDRRPDSRRDIYFNPQKDFYIDLQKTPIEYTKETTFKLVLESKLTKAEKAEVEAIEDREQRLNKARELKFNSQSSYYHFADLNDDSSAIVFSFTLHYYIETDFKGVEKLRSEIWVGNNRQRRVPSEMWDAFYAIYLQPLRDAVSALQPPYSKLGEHFDFIGGSEDQKRTHAQNIHKKMKEETGWQGLISEATTNIQDGHLKKVVLSSMPTNIQIGFLSADFHRIANQLRVRFPFIDSAENPEGDFFDTDQNGLGYNNLVFASTVLANLTKRQETDSDSSSFLLIEEPEAHLHPQAQNQFFSYLNTLSGDNCQIFVTSHSPTLTAKTDLVKIIVLDNVDGAVTASHMSKLNLGPDDERFMRKFMDVTKSQLYFAQGVIFVEGYSEALCLPEFGRLIGVDFDKEGVELVNIQGVAFTRFIKLYKSEHGLRMNFSLLTDKDATKKNGESRVAKLQADLDSYVDRLYVSDGENFEDSIYAIPENRPLLNKIWAEVRPADKSEGEIATFMATPGQFEKDVDRYDLKTEIALKLSEHISESSVAFTVPDYIKKAIHKAVGIVDEPEQ